jgi:hypothetical protein
VVAHNLFVGCGRYVSFHDADNTCDCNGYAGCSADGPFRLLGPGEWLDLDAWRLFHGFEEHGRRVDLTAHLMTRGKFELNLAGVRDMPRMPVRVQAPLDLLGQARDSEAHEPGPFAQLSSMVEARGIDPRRGLTGDGHAQPKRG